MSLKKALLIIAIAAFVMTSHSFLWAQDDLEYMPYWWKGRNFTGEIRKIEGNWITVEDFSNSEKKFEINVLTKFFLRSCDKLEEGLYVKVVYKETKQKNIARAIREIKREPKNEE